MDTLNEKMGLKLAHHDVNWYYNLQHLKGKSYYMKARDDKVWLIQYLPESSKGLNKDFPIVSGGWHNAFLVQLKKSTRWGIRSRKGLTLGVVVVCIVWLLIGVCLLFFPFSFGQPSRFGDHP